MPADHAVRTPTAQRITRSRFSRCTAAAVVTGLALGAVVTSGGGAAAAVTGPRAQSVGRFLDGSAGGMSLQSVVNLKDARATASPSTSSRNPVAATLLGAAAIPIGNGLKLPGGGVFEMGAANQIAVARTSEYSYGAAGAIDNTGGAQLTDKAGTFPSDGTVDLNGAALNSLPVPGLRGVPGLTSASTLHAAVLGGVVAKIGAVQALAQTETGGKIVTPQSSLADLQLAIGSPALGALLTQLKTAFDENLLGQLQAVPGVGTLLDGLTAGECSLTSVQVKPITLDKGGVVIDASNATITIDVKALLKQLTGVDIADLSTSDFDVITFLVRSLPRILSKGLARVVAGITTPLEKQFTACTTALTDLPGLGTLAGTLTSTVDGLQTQLLDGIDTVADPLIDAGSGGLATLADGLTGVVDIGLNVQSGPNIQPHNSTYRYTSRLAKTPDQATNVVKGQSVVRAIEIDLLDAATTGGLPGGLPSISGDDSAHVHRLAGRRAAADGSVVSLALANAAAGPSRAAPTSTPTTATPSAAASSTSLPTGVPAGAAGHDVGGSPLVPVALLLLGLVVAGGGVLTLRTRGRFSR